jgi:hypothetical protein
MRQINQSSNCSEAESKDWPSHPEVHAEKDEEEQDENIYK